MANTCLPASVSGRYDLYLASNVNSDNSQCSELVFGVHFATNLRLAQL